MTSSTMPLHAALYPRVSRAWQAEHDVSIPDQKRQGEAYCEREGCNWSREVRMMGSKSRLLQMLVTGSGVNSERTQGLKWRGDRPRYPTFSPWVGLPAYGFRSVLLFSTMT
jgi:hypothetical protein